MKFLTGGLIVVMSLAPAAAFAPRVMADTPSAGANDGIPTLLTELQFGSTTPMETTSEGALSAVSSAVSTVPMASGWGFSARFGASLGVEATAAPNGAGTVDALEGSYPSPGAGGNFVMSTYTLPAQYSNVEDIYIEFWAKMPGVKEGCKFVKIFGVRGSDGGYANTTIGANYAGGDYGSIYQVSFGDGSTLGNDTQHTINLNGSNPQSIGRSYGTAVVETPQMSAFTSADWGTGWHHFMIHVKFNSGTSPANEVPNGEYFLEIDGKVYVDATGLYNRNPANGPIESVEFFGWAQSEYQPFQIWYDDIRISTGGFISQDPPSPPANVVVK